MVLTIRLLPLTSPACHRDRSERYDILGAANANAVTLRMRHTASDNGGKRGRCSDRARAVLP